MLPIQYFKTGVLFGVSVCVQFLVMRNNKGGEV